MADNTHPTLGSGKICYLEIPATDIAVSAAFYQTVFGWRIRTRSDGSVSFDDGVGEVSGSWLLDREPAEQMGTLIHIMVDDGAATVEAIKANGGTIVQNIDPHAREVVARFRDPAGNMFGVYQHRSSGG
ncbi:MAG: VOC family protein [Pyrinomonadaceae bacterium]